MDLFTFVSVRKMHCVHCWQQSKCNLLNLKTWTFALIRKNGQFRAHLYVIFIDSFAKQNYTDNRNDARTSMWTEKCTRIEYSPIYQSHLNVGFNFNFLRSYHQIDWKVKVTGRYCFASSLSNFIAYRTAQQDDISRCWTPTECDSLVPISFAKDDFASRKCVRIEDECVYVCECTLVSFMPLISTTHALTHTSLVTNHT